MEAKDKDKSETRADKAVGYDRDLITVMRAAGKRAATRLKQAGNGWIVLILIGEAYRVGFMKEESLQ